MTVLLLPPECIADQPLKAATMLKRTVFPHVFSYELRREMDDG
jgi:hypothetical protein